MNYTKLLTSIVGLILLLSFVVGCNFPGTTSEQPTAPSIEGQPIATASVSLETPQASGKSATSLPGVETPQDSDTGAAPAEKPATAATVPTETPPGEPPAAAAPASPTPAPLGNPPAASIPTVPAPHNCTLYPKLPGECGEFNSTNCTDTFFNSKHTIAYNRPDWMGGLPDDLLLSELSLPGTHDTMAWRCREGCFPAYALAQSLPLDRQLAAGIRVLDIRVKSGTGIKRKDLSTFWDGFKEFYVGLILWDYDTVNKGQGRWWIFHGPAYLETHFGYVLRTVVDYLYAHPTETVLMNLQPVDEDKGEHNARMFEMYMDKSYKGKQYREWVWQGDPETGYDSPPRLGEVRGKIVILENEWYPYEGPRRFGIDTSSMVNKVGWEMQAAFCDINYKGDFDGKIRLGFGPKFDQIRNSISNSMTDPNSSTWYVTGLNGSDHVFPIDVANGIFIFFDLAWCDGMNERTYYYLTSCFRDQCAPFILDNGEHGRLGIVWMDFPGAGLIDAIIAHNGLPRLVVDWGGPFPDIEGWGNHEKNYATIHSADINGDGVEDQLGRANTGMEAWGFKADSHSWVRGASNGPFRDAEGWDEAKYYATIHSADIDGDGRDELLGRAPTGMEVWRFDSSQLVWERVATDGPFPDEFGWNNEKHYATIHSADIDGDGVDELLGRSIYGMEVWRFKAASNSWVNIASGGPFPDDDGWDEAKYYATIHSADINGDGRDDLLGRAPTGMEAWGFNATSNSWVQGASNGPFPDEFGWHHEKHYATIHSADLDGDGRDELLGRAVAGMEVWRFDASWLKWEPVAYDGPFRDADGWDLEKHYATIHSADFDGDGRDELLGRALVGMEVWRFDAARLKWDLVCTVPY